MKEVQFLIKVIFITYTYQLQGTGIINYSESVNNDIICPNNLTFSSNTKCCNRNFGPKEYMLRLTIQTCHYLHCGVDTYLGGIHASSLQTFSKTLFIRSIYA